MCRAEGAGSERGLLLEPWLYTDLVDAGVAARRAAAMQRGRLIDPKSVSPFGTIKMPVAEEAEIAIMFFVWTVACLTPLLPPHPGLQSCRRLRAHLQRLNLLQSVRAPCNLHHRTPQRVLVAGGVIIIRV